MKVLLVVHGYPPELIGGTENSTRATALGLLRLGHDVVVVSGSLQWEQGFRTSRTFDRDATPASGGAAAFPVYRIHRSDLYFDSWQKSHCPAAAEAFRDILKHERPDVVHLHHWLRLSDDLVQVAAQEGIASVVTLHDQWVSCLLAFRLPPSGGACTERPGPSPCLECVESVPPRTPWAARDDLVRAFRTRLSALQRELSLARCVLCLSEAHADELERYLDLSENGVVPLPFTLGREPTLRVRPEALGDPHVHGSLVLSNWGHLIEMKGVDLVLRALRMLEPEGLPVRLEVAGPESDPDYGARVRELARGLDVRFHGPFERGKLDVHPVARAHAFVSGTRAEETWGLVLDDALELGLPLVLPRVGAYPEHAPEGRGALFYTAREPAALAALIERLRRNPGAYATLKQGVPPLEQVAPSLVEAAGVLVEHYERALALGAPVVDPPDRRAELDAERRQAAWDERFARGPGAGG